MYFRLSLEGERKRGSGQNMCTHKFNIYKTNPLVGTDKTVIYHGNFLSDKRFKYIPNQNYAGVSKQSKTSLFFEWMKWSDELLDNCEPSNRKKSFFDCSSLFQWIFLFYLFACSMEHLTHTVNGMVFGRNVEITLRSNTELPTKWYISKLKWNIEKQNSVWF